MHWVWKKLILKINFLKTHRVRSKLKVQNSRTFNNPDYIFQATKLSTKNHILDADIQNLDCNVTIKNLQELNSRTFQGFSSTFKHLICFQALSRALKFLFQIQAFSRISQACNEPWIQDGSRLMRLPPSLKLGEWLVQNGVELAVKEPWEVGISRWCSAVWQTLQLLQPCQRRRQLLDVVQHLSTHNTLHQQY